LEPLLIVVYIIYPFYVFIKPHPGKDRLKPCGHLILSFVLLGNSPRLPYGIQITPVCERLILRFFISSLTIVHLPLISELNFCKPVSFWSRVVYINNFCWLHYGYSCTFPCPIWWLSVSSHTSFYTSPT